MLMLFWQCLLRGEATPTFFMPANSMLRLFILGLFSMIYAIDVSLCEILKGTFSISNTTSFCHSVVMQCIEHL